MQADSFFGAERMHTDLHSEIERQVAEFARQVSAATEESGARRSYEEGFARLRTQWTMYPSTALSPSGVFEQAASTARTLAAVCLPLGIAVAMHLYPLCALQCVPLPSFSLARFKRAILLQTIRARRLIVANAGSERARDVDAPLIATPTADGIRIDGTYEYMSLASVADLVFFKAQLAGSNDVVLCAADLRAAAVRVGAWKFQGNMRLSDTASVTFAAHRVPHGRYLVVPDAGNVQCIAEYQRCWFHLFLADVYLARLERLHDIWGLPTSTEQVVSLNELARLREYSLRLLDEFRSGTQIDPLTRTTSALKLRVSLLAQAAMAALRSRAIASPPDAQRLEADAAELGFIRWQPTADERILRSLGVGARGTPVVIWPSSGPRLTLAS